MLFRTPTIMHSEDDASVNWVFEGDFAGSVEARYVRRYDDRFIVYLSSQTGCRQACRFCHLTQTGQTTAENVDTQGYLAQAAAVLGYYDQQHPAEKVHFNFMARGELLANEQFVDNAPDILGGLAEQASQRGLLTEWKCSTIMPKSASNLDLARICSPYNPDIYYSLYSVNPAFRRRWLPKAMPVVDALAQLHDYQQHTRKIIALHWALIAGENDNPGDVEDILDVVRNSGLRVDFNLVRYNPYSPVQGRESDDAVIDRVATQLQAGIPEARVKIIPRVGFDVKASCGMFVGSGKPSKQLLTIS